MTRRALLLALAAVAAAATAGLAAGRAFRRDLARARARLEAAGARPVATRAGPLAVAAAGSGAPVLVLHGSGGGFDQGLAVTRPLQAAGFRAVAPSRFGYPGSPMPEGATAGLQADALADLLDALGIAALPVVGASAGAIPALHMALRHPARVAALVLVVPAAWAPGRVPVAWSPAQERLVAAALGSDLLFWTALRTAPGALTRALLGTDPALVAAADAAERTRVRSILEGILPVSLRAAGLLHDTKAAGSPEPLPVGAIQAPVLALSFADDLYGTAAAARDLAARIPGARLRIRPQGGHVGVGQDAALWSDVAAFLRRPGPS